MKINYSNNISQYDKHIAYNRPAASKSYSSSASVSFCGAQALATANSPYLKSTFKSVQRVYRQYEQSLHETSLPEIKQAVSNVETKTGASKQEILSAMQSLTQFASLKSVKQIGQVLNKYKVASIGNTRESLQMRYFAGSSLPLYRFSKNLDDTITNDFGLHKSLDYLLNKKNIRELDPFSNKIAAVFLDENKVAQFEKLKQKDEKLFNKVKNLPNVKYFMISGWDSGITFIDRTKNLEDETVKLLEKMKSSGKSADKTMDSSLLKRIHTLGFSPIIIKNEGTATESCVHTQMAPEKMTLGELYNILNANSYVKAAKNNDAQVLSKQLTVDYLKDNLKVYTPETLSLSLKKLHGKITEFAQKQGKTEDDIIYIAPEKSKSYSLMNYMYSKINNTPAEKFMTPRKISADDFNAKGKLLVLLDDCSFTGDSLNAFTSSSSSIKKAIKKSDGILCACVCASKNTAFKTNSKRHLIVLDEVKGINMNKDSLYNTNMRVNLGHSEFGKKESFCVVFPYMGPDNNHELGAIIALLHNVNYRETPKQYEYALMGVKSITKTTENIMNEFNSIKGSSPLVMKHSLLNISQIPKKDKINKNWIMKLSEFFGFNPQS